MDTLIQDIRFGLRMLARRPGFTAIAIIALALGIGANTAIFSVVNSILLRPLPYREPERLVQLNHNYPQISLRASVSAFGYTIYRREAKSFEQIAAMTGDNLNLTDGGEPERLTGGVVTASFFPLLGVEAARGRVLVPEDEKPGRNRVAVLSDALWQRRFGGDPGIVNKTITLNGENYTVIGVLPAHFQFGREFGRSMDLWVPLTFTDEQLRPDRLTFENLAVFARLRHGVTFEQAQAEMDNLADNVRREYAPQMDRNMWGLALTRLSELVVGDIRPALLVLLGAVSLVLLIACANVANLLLARAADRQREMAIRAALGAGRFRVIRQLLTESLLLALAGGLLGLGLAAWGLSLLLKLKDVQIPRVHEIGPDLRVLAFTLGVSVLTGVIFGLVPALQSAKTELHETLKEGGRSGASAARGWLRSSLVVLETALALMLLVGAGLLVRSFWQLQHVNPGFDPQHLLSLSVSLPDFKYREPAQRVTFLQQALEQIRALPGVESAGAVSILPLSGTNSSGSFQIEGRVIPQGQSSPHGDRWAASAGYFETMKIPLIRGRFFSERDTAEAPGVALIDETMARKYWPNEDPIGKRITFQRDQQGNPRWREIIGIVGHVKHRGLEGESRVQYYLPATQVTPQTMFLVIRTAGEPTAIVGAARGVIRNLDRELPVFRVTTMEQLVSDSMTQRRFAVTLLGIFAAVALVLAAVGLYGVLAYSVTQRSHEIGIRMALGAEARDVMKLVVRQGMTMAGIGVGLGLIGAAALTRLMASLLFGVSARDPLTFAAIALLLAAVALVACLVPARRATRVDPMIALRYE